MFEIDKEMFDFSLLKYLVVIFTNLIITFTAFVISNNYKIAIFEVKMHKFNLYL